MKETFVYFPFEVAIDFVVFHPKKTSFLFSLKRVLSGALFSSFPTTKFFFLHVENSSFFTRMETKNNKHSAFFSCSLYKSASVHFKVGKNSRKSLNEKQEQAGDWKNKTFLHN